MFPLRDTTPSKNYPVVNSVLIGFNVVIYLLQTFQGDGWKRFVYVYGLVPARYSIPEISAYFSTGQQMFSLFTFMFLHGGFWHLLGNMWSLYIFGDNVEDRLGHLRYLAFYLFCGLGSGLAHLALNLHSNLPTIGASGAIAGVMGAYIILYPNSKILTLIPIIFIPLLVEIPAFVFLGFWFLLQVLNAGGQGGGIAWWSHIGGFILGILLLRLFLKIPITGVTEKIRQTTAKKKTSRLQVIRPEGPGKETDLFGTIVITPYEALAGTRKTVNIPWGFQTRLFNVTVPPKTKDGSLLRLKGLGKLTSRGERGDFLLKVVLKF
jgi:membrane associated rhomboid family serine protease